LTRLRFAAIAISLTLCIASAQDLKILTGAVEHQVLQRDPQGRADLKLTGMAAAKFNNRYMEARVLKQDGSPLLDWNPSAERIKAGKWTSDLKGIPIGGPYKVETRVSGIPAAIQAIDDLWVGDLWVLAGQSNMEGIGNLVDTQAPVAAVHTFDMADNWAIAQDPLHRLRSSVDPVHWVKNEKGDPERWTVQREDEELYNRRRKGAGLGLPFAVEMYRRTGVPVGLIPCAHGGTSMDQWNPAEKAKGGASLYGATARRIAAVGGKVKGVLWYQGESDANDKAVGGFAAKFEALVAAFRADTGQADLPFYYVQIGRFINGGNPGPWNQVQEAQRLAETKIPHTGMVTAVDLALDDLIHVSTPDLKRLGRRLAMLAARDLFPDVKESAAYKKGPRPVAAKVNGESVAVKFAEVNGQLVSEGRISGFSIHDAKGEMLPMIYKARFEGTDTVVLDLIAKLPAGATLRYGAGKDPYCNVRDTNDMALPVFGPMAIAQ
jgi:sialate O-acetylesterase